MYASEKKFIDWLETEFARQIPFLKLEKIKRPRAGSACDLIISASHGKSRQCFAFEIKRAGYPQHIRNAVSVLEEFRKTNPGCYPVVAAPRIGEQGKKICNEHNVGYFDATGNVKIVSGGILIDKQGSQGEPAPLFVKTESQSQSLFSPRASRVAKCLLSEPERKWLQKDITAKTGLSKGMVSRIVKRMIETGYAVHKERGISLSSFDDLLSAWAEAAMKKRQAVKRYYIWSRNPQQLMRVISQKLDSKKVRYSFTQEAGASLTAPFSTFEVVSLYVESFDKFPAVSLAAEEADKGFNAAVFEPADPDIFRQARSIRNMKVVDDLQLYIDLMRNPLRGEKQARHLLSMIRKRRK